jgi:chromosome segregation ATPase
MNGQHSTSRGSIDGQHTTSQGSIDDQLAAKNDTIAALHAQIMEHLASSSEKDARIAYLKGALERASHTSADLDLEYQAFKRSQKEDAAKVAIIPNMHGFDAH